MSTHPQAEFEKTFGAERVVELCDGRAGLRAGLSVGIRQPADAPGQPIIEFVASDETLDRYDEVIAAEGWRLENYQRNPVFQNSHKYGDIAFTLGRALVTEVRGAALFQRVLFAVAENPVAKLAYDLYRGKFLNAVSVGFVPIRWEDGNGLDEFRRQYLEQELLEVSAVSIPANPNALQLALKAGAVEAGDLRELASWLKQFCSEEAGLQAEPGARGLETDGAQLLQLARDLRTILKRN